MPDFNRTTNYQYVAGTLSLLGSGDKRPLVYSGRLTFEDLAVSEGLPKGHAIVVTLNARWRLSVRQQMNPVTHLPVSIYKAHSCGPE